jgi:hypothetical protein
MVELLREKDDERDAVWTVSYREARLAGFEGFSSSSFHLLRLAGMDGFSSSSLDSSMTIYT